MTVVRNNYLCYRWSNGNAGDYRNWFLVKHSDTGARISIGDVHVSLPSSYLGKRVRFRMEVVE